LKNLFSKEDDVEYKYRRREREVDIICNTIRDKYPDVSRATVEEIMDMTLSFVEREVEQQEQ
jgi:hypothetical protein